MPDVIPQVGIPQPSQGLPSMIPGVAARQASAASVPSAPAAPRQQAPPPAIAGTRTPASDDPVEPGFQKYAPVEDQITGAPVQGTDPIEPGFANFAPESQKGLQNATGGDAISRLNSKSAPDEAFGSAEDIAKVHLGRNLDEQRGILDQLYGRENTGIFNGGLYVKGALQGTKEVKWHHFDGSSLMDVKTIAQASGNGTEWATRILSEIGLTGVGAAVGGPVLEAAGVGAAVAGPVGGAVGFGAGLLLSQYLGTKGREYLMERWGKIKPDDAQGKADIVVGTALNVLTGGLSAIMTGANMAHMEMRDGIKNILAVAGVNKKDLGQIRDLEAPLQDVGRTVLNRSKDPLKQGIVRQAQQRLDANIGQVLSHAVAASGDAPVPMTETLNQLRNTLYTQGIEFNEKGLAVQPSRHMPIVEQVSSSESHPSVLSKMVDNGEPATMFSPSAAPNAPTGQKIGTYSRMSQTTPFGSPEQGPRAINQLIDDYNAILASQKAKGGLPLSEFNRKVQGWQEGAYPDPRLYENSKINASFAELADPAAKLRNREIMERAVDPKMKELATGAYREYSEKIDPINAMIKVFNQNNQSPENFAKAIVRPDSQELLRDFKAATAHSPGTFKDLKQAYLSELIDRHTDVAGQFNPKSFMNEVDGLGKGTISELFDGTIDYHKIKFYANKMAMIQNSSIDHSSSLAAVASFMPGAQTMKSYKDRTLFKIISKNQEFSDWLVSKGLPDLASSQSPEDSSVTNTFKRFLKSYLLSQRAYRGEYNMGYKGPFQVTPNLRDTGVELSKGLTSGQRESRREVGSNIYDKTRDVVKGVGSVIKQAFTGATPDPGVTKDEAQ